MELNHIKHQRINSLDNIMDLELDPRLDDQFVSGLPFMDRICSATEDGFTPSMTILFSGMPGAGKTTMAVQMADGVERFGNASYYVSNEQSFAQLRKTCRRLNLKHGFATGTHTRLEDLLEALFLRQEAAQAAKREFLFAVDSLQTITIDGKCGPSENLAVTEALVDFCQSTYSVGVLVSMSNKSGDFAGKNQIRHTVDAHLKVYFDNDRRSDYYQSHVLTFTKNRHGIAGQVVQVEMTSAGMRERLDVLAPIPQAPAAPRAQAVGGNATPNAAELQADGEVGIRFIGDGSGPRQVSLTQMASADRDGQEEVILGEGVDAMLNHPSRGTVVSPMVNISELQAAEAGFFSDLKAESDDEEEDSLLEDTDGSSNFNDNCSLDAAELASPCNHWDVRVRVDTNPNGCTPKKKHFYDRSCPCQHSCTDT